MQQEWSMLSEAERPSEGHSQPSAARLCRMALDEARVNRNELERLYAAGVSIVGELRYDFLWRMSQLERVCVALERCAMRSCTEREEIEHTHEAISALALEGVEIRQDVRAILAAYRQEHRALERNERGNRIALARKRASNNSVRSMAAAFI
jgi:hypothetical protein